MTSKRRENFIEPLEPRRMLAIHLQLDYSLDTNGFFADTSRREMLQLAADAFEARLGDTLTAITPGGVNTWSLRILHPATGAVTSIAGPTIPADTILIYAGGRELAGSELGNGGPAGFTASGTQSFLNSIRARGESGALATPATDFAPFAGMIAFDTSASWFFGATTAGITQSQNDFYSVALHELGHVLGYGSADSWTAQSSGGSFSGTVSAATWGSAPLLSPDGKHWKDGTTSDNKEAAMDPTLLTGTRKTFTSLDWAGLDDIGWEILGAPTGSISGNVFNDANSNGVKDAGEGNLVGWTVYLDANNNATKDASEISATTDSNGNYTFTGLANGTYHVKQSLASGYRKTLPGTGVPGYEVTTTGAAVTGRNFGATRNILLAGTVFNDANANGVRDAGEAAIAGVTVNIISNGSTIATRTTDANGAWQVKGLSTGTGSAQVIAPSGYVPSNPANGMYAGTMSAGQQNANLNFALRPAFGAVPRWAEDEPSILTGEYESLDFWSTRVD